jgi:hypothetical protein
MNKWLLNKNKAKNLNNRLIRLKLFGTDLDFERFHEYQKGDLFVVNGKEHEILTGTPEVITYPIEVNRPSFLKYGQHKGKTI